MCKFVMIQGKKIEIFIRCLILKTHSIFLQIMVVNIIMSYFNNIALIMDLFFASLALTHPHKMGKRNEK